MSLPQAPAARYGSAVLAGLAATLAGNGLGRFAYTPLIPALVAAQWFDASAAAYLAAVNLAGYFIGALGARRVALAVGGRAAVRAAMLATALSLAACAWPLGFAWTAGWRLLAGITGGLAMVLAPPLVLAVVAPERRGRAGGIVFTGVGAGIAAAGLLVPALARAGLAEAWLALGGAVAVLTALVWRALPAEAPPAGGPAPAPLRVDRATALLLAAYGLDAVGFVPHTVFWVDYIARGLGQGLATGGHYWTVFGLAAAAGPYLTGVLADRIGLGRAYMLAMAVKAAGVALPLLSVTMPALAVSSLVVGALISGTTALCSGWAAERVGTAHHRQLWGWLTGGFAAAQAAAAWGASWLYANGGDHRPLFAIGAAALAVGAVLAWTAGRSPPRYPG